MTKKKNSLYQRPWFEETLLEPESLLCVSEREGSNPDLDENTAIDIFA
jgi:hypothetical protein